MRDMIRKAERTDLPECVRVIRNSFQTVADQFGFTEENAPRFTAFATTEERLAWHLDGEHRLMYLDEENGKACGYYSLKLNGDDTCELSNLSVLPEYRHRGIGGRLLEFAIGEKGVRRLWALEKNTRAIRFYERHGFRLTGERKYEAGTAEFLMRMSLPDVPQTNSVKVRGSSEEKFPAEA